MLLFIANVHCGIALCTLTTVLVSLTDCRPSHVDVHQHNGTARQIGIQGTSPLNRGLVAMLAAYFTYQIIGLQDKRGNNSSVYGIIPIQAIRRCLLYYYSNHWVFQHCCNAHVKEGEGSR